MHVLVTDLEWKIDGGRCGRSVGGGWDAVVEVVIDWGGEIKQDGGWTLKHRY